ncbi:MAG: hypothetical protein FWE69_01495 [Clostridiales bacterium]|nr:hypothetical protein [Clostridiales bacterium]
MKRNTGKRILSLLLGLVLALGLLPLMTFADGPVCEIGTTQYDNLGDALDAATDGDTIKLLANSSHHSSGILIKDIHITFDANGFILNVVGKGGPVLEVDGGQVQLVDSSAGQEGAFYVYSNAYFSTGVYAHNGGKAEVTSTVGVTGVRAIGAGSEVTVTGFVIGTREAGVETYDGASVTVGGNVSGGEEYLKSGVSAVQANTEVWVGGNVSGGTGGVAAMRGAAVTVGGNVHASGEDCVGAYASEASTVTIGGNVSIGNASGIGVMTFKGANNITIDGTITVPSGATYISINGTPKPPTGNQLSSGKPGYLEYSDNIDFVWVRVPYHAGDIAAVNAIIENNGLNWEKWETGNVPPASWTGVTWTVVSRQMRITVLSVPGRTPSLTDTLDASALSALTVLSCEDNNNLAGLTVSGLTKLKSLFAKGTAITSLDVSDCAALEQLDCTGTLSLETLTLGAHPDLLKISLNATPKLTGTLDASNCPKLTTLSMGPWPGTPLSRVILPGGYDMTFHADPAHGGKVGIASDNFLDSTRSISLFPAPNEGCSLTGWSQEPAITGLGTTWGSYGQFFLWHLTPDVPVTVTAHFSLPPVCEIVGGAQYADLADALAAVPNNGTIKLLADIDYAKGILITNTNLTFDVNGYTLNVICSDTRVTGYGDALTVDGGKLLLTDSSEGKTGALNVTALTDIGAGVYVLGGGTAEVTGATGDYFGAVVKGEDSSLTVAADVVGVADTGLLVHGGTAAVGGDVVGGARGVQTTGDVTVGGNVTGGTVGVFVSGRGTATVEGAILVPAGKAFISTDNGDKTQMDYERVSSKSGYWEYTDGESFVWVRLPNTATLRGDANCDTQVNAADAAAILRHLVELTKLTPQGLINAKVTAGTGAVNAADAAKILRVLVELEPPL